MSQFSVELPVRFVKTLEEEVTVVKGQPLYLSCELNKERDVVWRKDGKIVVEKPGKIVPGVIGLLRALTINDADDSDAGTYTVTVENANNLECSSCVKVVGQYVAGKPVTIKKRGIFNFQYQNISSLTPYLTTAAASAAESLQSCPTLCSPIDSSPPGSPVPGILQARTLEWVAISFSNAWKWKGKGKSLSHVRFLATVWTAAYQAPPSMGVSRQEYQSGGTIAFSIT